MTRIAAGRLRHSQALYLDLLIPLRLILLPFAAAFPYSTSFLCGLHADVVGRLRLFLFA